jgi:ParB-like chromosome segregation protein Spo0J
MKFHPYADLFPLMTKAELEALTIDIETNGQQQPVIVYQKQILDGRNRYLACKALGTDPQCKEFDGDDQQALALALSLNLQRRDLTASQRAIVAARTMKAMPERRGGDCRKSKVDGSSTLSRQSVAQVFKVGEKAVQQAKAVLERAGDLAGQVGAGEMRLDVAYERMQEREKEAERHARNRQRAGKYLEVIDAGEMTLEEALEKVMEDQQDAEHQQQARQIWFGHVADALAQVKTWVADCSDEQLAWYTQPGAPGAETHLTPKAIEIAIEQLQRVRSITFAGRP